MVASSDFAKVLYHLKEQFLSSFLACFVLQHMIATLGYMHSCSMPSRVNILAKKVINLLVKGSLKATAEDELKCIRFTLLRKSCPDDIRLHKFQKRRSDS